MELLLRDRHSNKRSKTGTFLVVYTGGRYHNLEYGEVKNYGIIVRHFYTTLTLYKV